MKKIKVKEIIPFKNLNSNIEIHKFFSNLGQKIKSLPFKF